MRVSLWLWSKKVTLSRPPSFHLLSLFYFLILAFVFTFDLPCPLPGNPPPSQQGIFSIQYANLPTVVAKSRLVNTTGYLFIPSSLYLFADLPNYVIQGFVVSICLIVPYMHGLCLIATQTSAHIILHCTLYFTFTDYSRVHISTHYTTLITYMTSLTRPTLTSCIASW